MTDARADDDITGICLDCGMKHSPEVRRRVLRPMADLDVDDIREAWPCLWPDTEAGNRMLLRDRAAMRRAA